MNSERHRELVKQGYTVRDSAEGYYLFRNGERVSGPHRTRNAAWDAASDDSYVRAMRGE